MMYQGEFESDVKFSQNDNGLQYLELIVNSTTQSKLDDFTLYASDPRNTFIKFPSTNYLNTLFIKKFIYRSFFRRSGIKN